MANVRFAQNMSLNRPPRRRNPARPAKSDPLVYQHSLAREHLHETGDDGLQQRVQLIVGGRSRLDKGGCIIGAAPIHPVQQQAVQGLA